MAKGGSSITVSATVENATNDSVGSVGVSAVVRSTNNSMNIYRLGGLFVLCMTLLQVYHATNQTIQSSTAADIASMAPSKTAAASTSVSLLDLALKYDKVVTTANMNSTDIIRTAVCYKTMFGTIDLNLVLQWIAYNRFIGFDHVFLYYRPEMISMPLFETLQQLPFVTLTEWTRGELKDYYDQRGTETDCLSNPDLAGLYDWVFLADIDEYLWLPPSRFPTGTIQEFIRQQQPHMNYISFGKYMYTLDHRLDMSAQHYVLDASGTIADSTTVSLSSPSIAKDSTNTPFVFDKYPFYMKYFCYGKRLGEKHCPVWKGRSKVLVRPTHHTFVDVHGKYYHPNVTAGAIHVDQELDGHVKEWPNIYSKHNITQQPRAADFTVTEEFDVHIHNLERAFQKNAHGNFTVRYDDTLQDWFSGVIQRAVDTIKQGS